MCRFLTKTGREAAVLPAARTPQAGSIRLDLATLQTVEDVRPLLEKEELSAILCVAGWTHVDGCEGDPERSLQVNATGPAALAAYAWERRLPFVYYSTDYVFNGFAASPGPYGEDAPTDPLSVYGRDKLAGEEQMLGYHPEALVLRTSGVYGADEQGKNFLYQVLKRLTFAAGGARAGRPELDAGVQRRPGARDVCVAGVRGDGGVPRVRSGRGEPERSLRRQSRGSSASVRREHRGGIDGEPAAAPHRVH